LLRVHVLMVMVVRLAVHSMHLLRLGLRLHVRVNAVGLVVHADHVGLVY
jgi:hypothetical protein